MPTRLIAAYESILTTCWLVGVVERTSDYDFNLKPLSQARTDLGQHKFSVSGCRYAVATAISVVNGPSGCRIQ
jgi:hypothetical protein